MTTLRDVDPDTVGTELETTGQSLMRQLGTDVAIVSTADLEQAVMDRTRIGDAIRTVEQYFAPLKRLAHELHATLCARERAVLSPLQQLDATRKTAISDYKAQVDREREAREQQLAEQQRRDEQTRATAEAAALEAAGQPELAAAVVDEAIARPAPAVSLPDSTRDVVGLKFRRRWCWRYAGGPKDVSTTPPAIVGRALAIMPREYLKVDEQKIGAVVRAMKTATKIPGVEVYPVDDPVR